MDLSRRAGRAETGEGVPAVPEIQLIKARTVTDRPGEDQEAAPDPREVPDTAPAQVHEQEIRRDDRLGERESQDGRVILPQHRPTEPGVHLAAGRRDPLDVDAILFARDRTE